MIARPLPVMFVIVLLSAWLGAALVVAASVAPAAFAVLPSRTLAGALVGKVLPAVFWSGIVVALVGAYVARIDSVGAMATLATVGLLVCCAVAQLVISPRIARIRESIGGPVDALSPGDPRRQAFGQLHGLSVGVLGVGVLAAAVAIVLFARYLTTRTTP